MPTKKPRMISKGKRGPESKSLYQKIEGMPLPLVILVSILIALLFGGLGLILGSKIITKHRPPETVTPQEIITLSGIITLIEDTEVPRLVIETDEEIFELKGAKTAELRELKGEKIQVDGIIIKGDKSEEYMKLEVKNYFYPKVQDTPEIQTVTMSGVVQPLGISIYMQGTHTLNDDSGEVTALLETPDDKLKLAEGAYVEITGILNESVEGELPFIKVEKITFR